MLLRYTLLLLVLFFFLPFCYAGDGKITLIHMGDIHGHLVPRPNMRHGEATTDYKVGGLAYLYSAIKDIRTRKPNNLLINTGDTIQGSAEALFSRGQHIVDILNLFNIDAFTPGNRRNRRCNKLCRTGIDNPQAGCHRVKCVAGGLLSRGAVACLGIPVAR